MATFKNEILSLLSSSTVPTDEHKLDNLIKGKNIILYGAGGGLITFFVVLIKKYKLNITSILDKKFEKTTNILGIPVIPLNNFFPTMAEKRNSLVIITVGRKELHKEIFDYLYGLGFSNVVLLTDIYEYHLHFPPKELEEKGIEFYLEQKESILDSFHLFSDNESREVFLNFLKTHMLQKPFPLPHHHPSEQYFPADIKLGEGYSRVINCGSYNGDTIIALNRKFGKIDSLACFEPDENNFAKLSKYISENSSKIADQLSLFPCGVYSSEIQLKFHAGNKFNSVISDDGNEIIQCVSIDNVLHGFNPTFINMDIEGAELEALKGAVNTIHKSKPDLAICVYHTPNHIWEIVRYLDELKLGYVFYLRNYTSFISETVLYATITK